MAIMFRYLMSHVFLCCKIYRTPRTPIGYADDLARMNNVMEIVHTMTGVLWGIMNLTHFSVWRRLHKHSHNSKVRFLLGPSKADKRE